MADKPDSLAAALAVVQAKLPEIKKSERADVQTKTGSFSYSYANLAGISAKIMPLLGEVGLSFIAKPTFVGDRFVLAYSLLHVSGEREDGEYPLPTGGTPQAIGSAITYGRRYCLCAVTGVAPEDDDDDAAVAQEQASKKGTAQRTVQPRQAKPAAREKPARPAAQRDSRKPPPLPGEDHGDGITEAQSKKLHALFNQIGWTDRADRLRAASTIVGREIASSNELTKDEASRLIDDLQAISETDEPAVALADHLEDVRQGIAAQEAAEAEAVQEELG